MKRSLLRPPSLVGNGAHRPALVIILIIAGWFRFWRLSSLPPGLAPGEAKLALVAHSLGHGGHADFGLVNGQTPLVVYLLKLEQLIFGYSPWVLRLLPALVGIVTVGLLYLLGRDILNRRSGLIAATLLAVSPWAVTLSRSVSAAAFVPFFVVASCYAGFIWWRRRSLGAATAIIVLGVLEIILGPAGWAILFVTGVAAASAGLSSLARGLSAQVTALFGLVIGVIPAIIIYVVDHAHLNLAVTATGLGKGITQTLSAFLFHGDDNYQFNLGGQPLLNIFMGIMLVAGILVVATRLRKLSYRVLGVSFIASLIPAMATLGSTPSASRLGLALISTILIVSIGVGYMLEIWYTTFPINSAARLTGQTAIVVLLALSAFQGYNQYFVAWALSSPTYGAYSDRALAMAHWASKQPASMPLLLVATPIDVASLQYGLVQDHHQTTIVTSPLNLAPHLTKKPLEIAIAATDTSLVVPQLKTSAAGGTLVPHLSPLDQSELFYSYEVH